MKNTLLKLAILSSFVLSKSVTGEVCTDFLNQIRSSELTVKLETTNPWYVSGELVQFHMVFKNMSNRPLLIPPEIKDIGGTLQFLSLVKVPEVPEPFWIVRSPSSGTFDASKHCETTLRPRVLLPNDTYVMGISNLEAWRNAEDGSSFIELAPSRSGIHKIQFQSGDLALRTDVLVKQVESFELRWLSLPDVNEAKPKLRQVILVRVKDATLVLLNSALYSLKDSETVSDFLSNQDRSATTGGYDGGFSGTERILLSEGELTFTDRLNRIMPASKEIEFSSGGSVLRSLNANRHGLRKAPTYR